MARSLFDELRARQAGPAQPPKLKPNGFAKLARFSWQRAETVVALWFLLALASAIVAWLNYVPPASSNLPLQASTTADRSTVSAFSTLQGMQTITLTNPKPEKLGEQRDELLAALRQRDDVFQVVFAPGAGDYYEANGFLYHPAEEVRGRVAYALSLKPLFIAIAAAPDAQSMAKLVSNIAAAIAQGRDPQGLDDLLSESAASVQALVSDEDKPVDWAKLADLSEENTATSVTLLAVPRAGQEAAARSFTLKLLTAVQNASDTVATLNQPGVSAPKRASAPIDNARLSAAIGIGLIFVCLFLALAFGRTRLVLVIFGPVAMAAAPLAAGLLLLRHNDWLAYWPLALGLLWNVACLTMHAVFAKITYANGQKAREAVAMLAHHHHGTDIAWLSLAAGLPYLGLMMITQGYTLALFAAGFTALSLLLALTLPTALLRWMPEGLQWRAGEWLVPAHRALFETGRWQWLARGIGVVLVACSAATLMLSPGRIDAKKPDVPVSVIASNAADADIVIKRLKAFSEAKAVRWLGMFMPQDEGVKREALHELKDQFPRITPVLAQSAADIRDQIDSLQDSLKEIATTEETKPRLKMAADEFRRSLALLSATAGDAQVRQLENRLFGGFNRLADRAETLATLPKPELASLPNELHTMFGTPEGAMRIEVQPIEGVSNARLAEILDQAGFEVLHPSVEQDQLSRAALSAVNKSLGVGLGLGVVVLLLAVRSVRAFGYGLALVAGALVASSAVAYYWQPEWTLTTLLEAFAAIAALMGFVLPAVRRGASTASMALELFLLPLLALAMALPALILGLGPLSNATFPLVSAIAAAAVIVGLLRQHRHALGVEY